MSWWSRTLSNWNLEVVDAGMSYGLHAKSSFHKDSGKWYVEVLAKNIWGSYWEIGIVHSDYKVTWFDWYFYKSYWEINQNVFGSEVISSNPESYTSWDIIWIAFDLDSNTVSFYKNNVLQETINGIIGTEYALGIWDGQNATIYDTIANFGQDSSFAWNKTRQWFKDSNGIWDFYYQPPAGYLALSTANLPEPTVVPSENFDVVTWIGNWSTQNITGLNFQPDFAWIKKRSWWTARKNVTYNVITGVYNFLSTNETKILEYIADGLSLFNSDGITIWANDTSNGNTYPYVGWFWKAGGSPVTNNDGTITSQVSANRAAWFSVIWYSWNSTINATVWHGLSKKPELIIRKNRNWAIDNWIVQLSDWDTVSWEYMYLNTTAWKATYSDFSTDYNSDNIILKSSNYNYNWNGIDYITYAFHSVEWYSKIWKYTGNGSTDGTFVYTGFKPKYIMIKRTDNADHWYIYDTERSTMNPIDDLLYANSNVVESTSSNYYIDTLSNWFKIKWVGTGLNASNWTYIYMTFAEEPFIYSNAR